jgi:hypothetical protein
MVLIETKKPQDVPEPRGYPVSTQGYSADLLGALLSVDALGDSDELEVEPSPAAFEAPLVAALWPDASSLPADSPVPSPFSASFERA